MPNTFTSLLALQKFTHSKYYDTLDGVVIVKHAGMFWYFEQNKSGLVLAMSYTKNLMEEK